MIFKPQTIELTDQERRDVVVSILTDSVILDRVYYAVSILNRACTREGETSWNAIDKIGGYTNAFPFMGISTQIKDEELSMKLAHVFNTIYKDELETGFKKDAPIIAEHIYTEWLDIVEKHKREELLKNSN